MNTVSQRVEQSAVVLANGAEFGAQVIKAVAGNDISDTLNGSVVTMDTLRVLAQSRFKRNFNASK